MAFKKGTQGGKPVLYRCIYCKAPKYSKSTLNEHEATCPSRYLKRKEWANEIDRAKRREAKRKLEDRDGGEKG